jgi:hypothetical protein
MITPIFNGQVGVRPEVSEDAKFDLHDALATLNEDEIRSLQMGVSLKDIFTARSSTKKVEVSATTQDPDLNDAVARARELFKM